MRSPFSGLVLSWKDSLGTLAGPTNGWKILLERPLDEQLSHLALKQMSDFKKNLKNKSGKIQVT